MYVVLFLFFSCVCGYLVYLVRVKDAFNQEKRNGGEELDTGNSVPDFKNFQRTFLAVYLLCCAADWIQGPYLYKLYAYYGFSKGEIGSLFVTGYVSSGVFGTIIAGMADSVGRRKTCLAFCAFYGLSCLTKHVPNFNILLIGRILGGISTSILFSVFETWYMHEHQRRHAYPDSWLVETLSLMTFGSSVVAIGTGVLAAILVDFAPPPFIDFSGGIVTPPSILVVFDCAILFLIIAAVIMVKKWPENDGGSSSGLLVGWVTLTSNRRIWIMGIVQACFEGAMYLFVFSWTPTLEHSAGNNASDVHHGLIFSTFMVCIMIGTNLLTILVSHVAKKLEKQNPSGDDPTQLVLLYTIGVAAVALSIPAFLNSHSVYFLCFCIFEVCVGVYMPAMAYQRLRNIPSEVRATIMNLFRVPLNVVVVLALLDVGHMHHSVISLYCGGLLLAAGAAQYLMPK
mmetsp:Transcript_10911/g.14208  ORF Transcript_10911/g.14208 Transcript_10911/m.14208 type:complete len:454 (+) Transcript_10911:283-1644(+)